MFRSRYLVGAYIVCFLWSASNTNYPVNLFLQDGLGYTARQASFAIVPGLLVASLAAYYSARLPERIGLRSHLFAFLAIEIVGILAYNFLSPANGYWGAVLPAMLLTQMGFVSVWISVRLLAVTGVPNADQGVASGVIFSMQQLGNAVGIPALSAVLNQVIASHGGPSPVARLAGFHAMFMTAVIVLIVAIAAGLLVLCRPPPRRANDRRSVGAPRAGPAA